MSNKTYSVQFTKKQVEYLMKKTGSEDPDEAIESFISIASEESVDPAEMQLYVKKLMDKDGVK